MIDLEGYKHIARLQQSEIASLKRTIATYENGRVVLLAEIQARDDRIAKLEASVEEWKVEYWRKEEQNTQLETRLAMAEDAAAKGDQARATADAMQQRIKELESK